MQREVNGIAQQDDKRERQQKQHIRRKAELRFLPIQVNSRKVYIETNNRDDHSRNGNDDNWSRAAADRNGGRLEGRNDYITETGDIFQIQMIPQMIPEPIVQMPELPPPPPPPPIQKDIDKALDYTAYSYLQQTVMAWPRATNGVVLLLPCVCRWFSEDFGNGSTGDVLRLVKKFLDDDKQKLLSNTNITVKYLPFIYECRQLVLAETTRASLMDPKS